MLTIMMSIFASVDTISGEIVTHTIHTIVTKPVQRWHVIIGKWLGHAGMLSVVILSLAGGILLIFALWRSIYWIVGRADRGTFAIRHSNPYWYHHESPPTGGGTVATSSLCNATADHSETAHVTLCDLIVAKRGDGDLCRDLCMPGTWAGHHDFSVSRSLLAIRFSSS